MLSPEQMAKFNATMDVDDPQPEVIESDQTAEPTPTPVESKPEHKDEHGSLIPYARFAEVNRERKALKERAEKLEQELNSYRNKPAQEKSFLEQLADEERGNSVPDEYAQRLSALEERHIKAEASSQLDQMITAAKSHYPDVPEKFLYKAIGEGKDIDEAAEEWNEIKRAVLGAQPQAPSRVATATPPIPGKAPPVGPRKPQTMEEAHQAFRRAMTR